MVRSSNRRLFESTKVLSRNLVTPLAATFAIVVLALCGSMGQSARADSALKVKLINLIAIEPNQYTGVGPRPQQSISRWEAPLKIAFMSAAPNREVASEGKDTVSRVLTRVDSEALPTFPDWGLQENVGDANVVFAVGDDFDQIANELTKNKLLIWSLLGTQVKQMKGLLHNLDCMTIVGRENENAIAAGLVFVNSKAEPRGRANCVAVATAKILGLGGDGPYKESIISTVFGSDLTALDLRALGVLYGRDTQPNESLEKAVDAYLME